MPGVKKMGLDLSTMAGVLRFAELRRAEMHGEYLSRGELEENPLFCLFATHDMLLTGDPERPLRTGVKLPKVSAVRCPVPEFVRQKLGWQQMTKGMGRAIKEMAKSTKAVGVLLMMDAWTTSSEPPEDRDYGWIEEQSDRREALTVILEHKLLPHPIQWTSFIWRDPLRLDPWVKTEPSESKGRLTGFVDWRS